MKITKKQIQNTLRTLDSTQIFRIAKLAGIDVNSRVDVMRFVEEYAPTQRIEKAAYYLTLCADHKNQLKAVHGRINQPIRKVVDYMRRQIKDGSIRTNYGKILIQGNNNIYWAHPHYRHGDYNKSVAMANTPANRRVMILVNSILNKSRN